MANGLAHAGRLTETEYNLWKLTNACLDDAYTSPYIYKKLPDAGLTSWYIEGTAPHLLDSMSFYTELLDRYGIPWREVRSSNPGEIVYRDDVQVVIRPFTHEKHWVF
ncbi:hypothetical protein [uncultured Rothia sp.]|uniref:hypothetical protein n=1 Tax=uncultured Rothia sp. TaxID=316088 RepID=UPI00321790B7